MNPGEHEYGKRLRDLAIITESVYSSLPLVETSLYPPPPPAASLDFETLGRQDSSAFNKSAFLQALELSGALTTYQTKVLQTAEPEALWWAHFLLLDQCDTDLYLVRSLNGQKALLLRLNDWSRTRDNLLSFLRRVTPWQSLRHENLLPLLDAGQCQSEAWILYEAREVASLEELIRSIGPMPESLMLKFALQLIEVVARLHEQKFVHGQITPRTCWIGPLQENASKKRPTPQARLLLSHAGADLLRTPASTWDPQQIELAEFLAPEMWHDDQKTSASDVYQLGLVFTFMLTGHPARSGNSVRELLEFVPQPLSRKRPDVNPEWATMIDNMLRTKALQRPSISQIRSQVTALLGIRESLPVEVIHTPHQWEIEPTTQEWPGVGSTEVFTPAVWNQNDLSFSEVAEAGPKATNYQRQSPARSGINRKTMWLLIGASILLNLLAVGIWVIGSMISKDR